ncbi:MAG: SRPBCC domain-containing protein [Candidatus Acidiferrales bacterium]
MEAKRHINAPAEKVYDAWLDPETAGKWLFTTPTGQMTRVEIDPVQGGKFLFVDRQDGENVEHVGEYLLLDRPHKIVFNVTVPKYSSTHTRVEVDIEESPEAGCDVTVLHDGVFQDFARRTAQGWMQILGDLEATLA